MKRRLPSPRLRLAYPETAHNPALGLILLAIMLGTIGCGDTLFFRKAPPVHVEPVGLEIRCPSLRPGAEVVMLPDQSPVTFSIQVTHDPFAATPEIAVQGRTVHWSATAVSAPSAATGEFERTGEGQALWTVPSQGGLFKIACEVGVTYAAPSGIKFTGAAAETGRGTILLRGSADLLVEAPTPGDQMAHGVLDGVPLGKYPDPAADDAKPVVRKHPEVYQRPQWFYRVGDSNRRLLVSPHFRLGDFDMTYDYWKPGYDVPYEYIALHPRLIEKLELVLTRLRETIDRRAQLVLLAGFRSPNYNEEVKRAEIESTQTARYSMHLYGRAADFIVDTDGDGRMDDLNHDGTIDIEDARLVRNIVDRIDAASAPGMDSLLGGCGVYPRHDIASRKIQTPYVHIDVRGYLNDSGKPVRWEMP